MKNPTLARMLSSTLKEGLRTTPKSLLLIGPRQTGKSTLFRQLKPQLEINLSNEETYRSHLKDPGLIEALANALPAGSTMLVDEIQRIPSLLNTVQALIDGPREHRFLLTGSSARKLKHGQVNLLPGRIFRYDLFPLTYWELIHHWDLLRALTLGGLPEVYLSEYGPELLKNYVNSYLREEIQAEALTRNIDSFARFLDIAAEASGQIFNYSQVSSDSEIPKETLRRYIDILEDTLLIHRLPGFTDTRGSRKAIQKEKFLFFDLGVRNAILAQEGNVFTDQQLGLLFEQWLINQIFALRSYLKLNWKLYYYRDDLKREVDLIIDRGKDILAVEIKFKKKFMKSDLVGLQAFAAATPKKTRSILVYRGNDRQTRENCEVLPYQDFLAELAT